jgi:hypothetical protein
MSRHRKERSEKSRSGVMAGLVPAISTGKTLRIRNGDARAKPAHDAILDCPVAQPATGRDPAAQ